MKTSDESSRRTEAPLTVEAALALLFDRVALDVLDSEQVPVEQAIGRVLAEAGRARWPLPNAPTSIMDGYAVRSSDLVVARDEHQAETLALELASESAAGHPSAAALEPGTCARIATGAVVPAGADAVVPQEDTRRIDVGARTLIELSSVALAQVAPGRWVRPIGSDVRQDDALLEPGELIGGGEASLLAGTGNFEVLVRRRPKVAILSSGDELVAIGQTPGRGQVVSTNAMLLAAQIREAGGEPCDLGVVADTHAALRGAIEQAIETADILVASGGISVGDHDLTLPVLRELGLELGFRKVELRPGRPTTFGVLPRARAPLPVLALPGNPASTLVAFELFVRPLIRAMLGLPRARWFRPRRTVELASEAEGDRRREHWIRARLDEAGRAVPLPKQLSGALRSIAGFDALVRIPAGRETVAAGDRLEAMIVRE
ncbi:MAG TPA: gephyrin-like molybdotransferase Glp [Enhygromyxa sp.]|nr:gephyrin-like molybdotransferase Glp [Enhygromyxa sp.]